MTCFLLLNVQQRSVIAKEIMQRFLLDTSPDQINLSSNAMKKTVEKIKAGYFAEDLFVEALKEAVGNMEWDSSRKFLASPLFLGNQFYIASHSH